MSAEEGTAAAAVAAGAAAPLLLVQGLSLIVASKVSGLSQLLRQGCSASSDAEAAALMARSVRRAGARGGRSELLLPLELLEPSRDGLALRGTWCHWPPAPVNTGMLDTCAFGDADATFH